MTHNFESAPSPQGSEKQSGFTSPQGELIDGARVLDLLSLNTADEPLIFDELLELFISETTAQMSVLRRSASAADHPAIRRVAHRLKGSTRSFGIPLMGDQCEMLERIAETTDPSVLANYIDQMEETFALAVRSLQRYAKGRV